MSMFFMKLADLIQSISSEFIRTFLKKIEFIEIL